MSNYTQLTKSEIAAQLQELVKNANRYETEDFKAKVDALVAAYFEAKN